MGIRFFLTLITDMYIIYHKKGGMIMKHRSNLSAKERRIISRIHWLISKPGLLRANLVEMKRRCGNKNCRCAKGKLHKSWYLYQSKGGKPHMLYIPAELEEDAVEWVNKYKEIKDLLEELSQIYWKKIKEREV